MLTISIVLYHPKWEQEVMPLLEELLHVHCLHKIYLIDNSEQRVDNSQWCTENTLIRYIFNGVNMGYGAAHNIAIRESAYHKIDFHLVMNSDIQVKATDIDAMHDWMIAHPLVGQLMPKVVSTNGSQQFLAKRLPSPMDVFCRRFLPKRWIAGRNKLYELRDKDLSHPINAPYLSGCFMFLRTRSVVEAGLFDERYFMYPEDIDLTRTIHRNWLTLYHPGWTIVHAHEQASYKNRHMLWIHITNMCRYFNKWGWFFDAERQTFNNL